MEHADNTKVMNREGELTQVYLCLLVVQPALLGSGVRGDGDPSGGTETSGSYHPHHQHGASVESLLTADLEY